MIYLKLIWSIESQVSQSRDAAPPGLVQIILSAKFFNLCPIFKNDTVERLLPCPSAFLYRAPRYTGPMIFPNR